MPFLRLLVVRIRNKFCRASREASVPQSAPSFERLAGRKMGNPYAGATQVSGIHVREMQGSGTYVSEMQVCGLDGHDWVDRVTGHRRIDSLVDGDHRRKNIMPEERSGVEMMKGDLRRASRFREELGE